MSGTNIKFKIVCTKYGKEHRGKPIAASYVKQCKCGHTLLSKKLRHQLKE
ncbi:hypothetical protein GTH52_15125 (plasmid) [Clostridium tyrobutyricum]|nr:hypothetical protein [Clostridium tyrobutyricum]AND86376.1 hypothetical protein CTK_P00780 [Clostridium tyrobutyricum]MBV4435788.1 hypothetical protein [Clostridium tyrobutyricum]QNB68213.1 hypothetical protein GTH52_15125 [Clostridium tyrobutyricum]